MAINSDSDTISVTSTVPSEQKDEYPVEAILAETISGDGKFPLYLVKWEDYPVTRATWEPAASFGDDSTLRDWGAKKYRQEKGLEPAFDIEDFKAQLRVVENAKAKRKVRRKAKKKRLGIPTSSDEGEPSQNDSDEAPIRNPRSKKRSVDPDGGDDGDDGDDDGSDIGKFKKDRKGAKKQQSRDEESDGLTSDDSLLRDIKLKELNKKHQRLRKKAKTRESRSSTEQAASRPRQEAPSRRPSIGTVAQGRQPSRRTSDVSGHQTDAAKPATAKATARRAPNVQAAKVTSNVLANWNKEPPKRNPTRPDHNNPHTPNTNPHLFGKRSVMRRYEKAGRNERAPQEGALQLFKPGEWNPRSFNKTQTGDSGPSKDKNRDGIPGEQDYKFGERNEGNEYDTGAPVSNRAPHSAGTQFRRPSQDASIGRASQAPRIFPQATGNQPLRPSKGTINSGTPVQAASAHPQHSLDSSVVQKSPVKKLTLTEYNQRCTAVAIVGGKDKECEGRASMEDKNGGGISEDTKDKLSSEETLRATESIDSTGSPGQRGSLKPQQKAVSLPGVIADIKIGASKVEAGRLRLIGVPPDLLHKWISAVGSPPYLWLKKTVSADHFKKNWEPNKGRVLGEGEVQGDFKTLPEELLDLLRFYGGAGVHVNKLFAMIIYPANVEAWQYMRQSSVSSAGQLRWVAFVPHDPNDSSKLAWHSTNPNVVSKYIYEHLFKIRYSELLPRQPGNPQSKQVPSQVHVFIMADTSFAWNEALMLYKALKLSGAVILWSGQEGAWDYFSQHVKFGILLLHNNYRRYGVSSVPRLASVLNKNITIFEFGRPYHVNKSGEVMTTRGKFGCYRLFPHGGCVLLTDQLLMNDPKGSYEVLRWFKKRLADSRSNTWKVVLRPGNVDGWFLHGMVSKADVNNEDFATLTARTNIYQEISEFMYKPPGSEYNDPDESNIQQIAGNDMLGDNDPFLQVANLAIWAGSNCTKYRRFIAINPTTNIPNAESFPIVELMSPEQFLQKYAY